MKTSNKVILVTGSNGFIGKELVRTLENKGHKVVRFDRNILYKPRILKSQIRKILPAKIFHLAAYGNHSNQKDISKIVYCNYIATYNLLDATKDLNIDSFINTGSSSEYGRKRIPMKEDMHLETDTFYGATKAGSTYLSRAFAKQFNMHIVTVRPFSVYGPGEDQKRFIPTVIKCALNEETLNLAQGVHDWIYISDFI
ncbi:MAG: NAD-dependent epimerase/dehydratase family protein [Patescibacteria group bacterium]